MRILTRNIFRFFREKKPFLRGDIIHNFERLPLVSWIRLGYLDFISSIFPLGMSRTFALLPFVLVGLMSSRIHRAMANLAIVYPTMSTSHRRWLAWQALLEFGQSCMEYFMISAMPTHKLADCLVVDSQQRQTVDRLLLSGRPVIFVASHCGSFSAISSVLNVLFDRPVSHIVHGTGYSGFDRFKMFYGSKSGYCFTDGDIAGIQKMVRLMKKGVPSVIIVDGYRDDGVMVPWLGKESVIPDGHVRLAARLRAIMVPVHIHSQRGPYRLHVRFEDAVTVDDDLPRNQAMDEALKKIANTMQGWVLAHPTQWFWFSWKPGVPPAS